jgi:hypothetical protein
MSTELLEKPTKMQNISDDLESAFWVLLYHALRFVKHNQTSANIDMGFLFDFGLRKEVGGKMRSVGGQGKRVMLTGPGDWADLEFESSPLTWLFKELHKLFEQALLYRTLTNQLGANAPFKDADEKLQDAKWVIQMFEEALESDGWPEDDEVPDQLPPSPERKPFLPTVYTDEPGSRPSSKRSQQSQGPSKKRKLQ